MRWALEEVDGGMVVKSALWAASLGHRAAPMQKKERSEVKKPDLSCARVHLQSRGRRDSDECTFGGMLPRMRLGPASSIAWTTADK